MMLYLTGAPNSLMVSPDAPQNDPRMSLGGYVSSTPVPNAAVNVLFDQVALLTLQNRPTECMAFALINKAGGENADHGNAEGDPLYTYVYWQETTLHAGEDPDAEREYLEVFRTQVRQGSNAVTTEVLSDTLEGVGSFVGVEGLGGLLTFTAEVPQETADALRDPAQFAGA